MHYSIRNFPRKIFNGRKCLGFLLGFLIFIYFFGDVGVVLSMASHRLNFFGDHQIWPLGPNISLFCKDQSYILSCVLRHRLEELLLYNFLNCSQGKICSNYAPSTLHRESTAHYNFISSSKPLTLGEIMALQNVSGGLAPERNRCS